MIFQDFTSKYNLQLNEQQQKAVQIDDGQTLLLAVPGSGKTTVIVARTGWLILGCNVNPQNILTITYSKAAALEMEERFVKLFATSTSMPKFSTINSLCVTVLNYIKRTTDTEIPTLEPETGRIIRAALYEKTKIWASDAAVNSLGQLITLTKNKMLSEAQIRLQECAELNSEYNHMTFFDFFNIYELYKQKRNIMDFDDQLTLCYDYLLKFPNIRKHFQDMFPYISVDETQDTSLIQYEIIKILAERGKSLFVVGDDDQSIYGFRGAEPANILNFRKSYPQAKILYMETNYRSCPTIVNAADSFIKSNSLRFEKTIKAAKTEGGTITTCFKETEIGVRNEVVKRVKEMVGKDETLAILARNYYTLIPILDAIQKENIPVALRGNPQSFFTQSVVASILSVLKLAIDRTDMEAFKGAKKVLKLYIKNTQMDIIEKIYNDLNTQDKNIFAIAKQVCLEETHIITAIQRTEKTLDLIAVQSPSLAIKTIQTKFDKGMYDFGNTDETELNSFSVNIGALKFLANDYNDVKVFLKAVSQYTDENHKYSRKSNIVISTIHSSKGLEFDNVIILDAINGILPQTEELNALQGDKEEDSRLFYVGVTRAKNKVEFIVPKTLFGIRVVPSMFIGRLGTDVVFPNLNKSTTDDNNFAISKRIKHAVFGEGTIIEIKDDVLVIAFDSGKTKQILSNFCKPI